MLKVGVIVASVREVRRGEAFARWFLGLLAAREGVEAELVDLREWPIGSYVHRQMAAVAEKDYAAGTLERRWADKVASLDAFAIVTPEYNHGYPGALKNALDALYTSWNHKAVAFVGYGGSAAGARAIEQLRLVAIELRMVAVRDAVNLGLMGLAADERGFPTSALDAKRAAATIDDLLWWARAAKDARERHPR